MNGQTPKTTTSKARKISVSQTRSGSVKVVTDNLSKISRTDLEKEVLRLRQSLNAMQRAETVDKVSGLSNRGNFLDQAQAEFNRSRRYEHDLTLVVTDIIGLDRIARDAGESAPDQVITAIAQMCLSSSRFGVDVLGRITENQIAVMLPETPIAGGLSFMSRMRKLVTGTPITLANGVVVKPGLKVSADRLRDEDDSFLELFERTWKRTNKKSKASKPSRKAVA